jgi:hypothetical protein
MELTTKPDIVREEIANMVDTASYNVTTAKNTVVSNLSKFADHETVTENAGANRKVDTASDKGARAIKPEKTGFDWTRAF